MVARKWLLQLRIICRLRLFRHGLLAALLLVRVIELPAKSH